MRVDMGGIPETVSDFEPRTLWAMLDGQPCTLLDAKMGVKHKGFDLIQTYEGSRLLRGAHLDGEDAVVEGVRMVLPVPGAGWSGDSPVTTELGTVSGWAGKRGPGIEFRPAQPVRVWDLTQHTKSDITVLPRLWSSRDEPHTQVELLVPGVGWCPFGSVADVPRWKRSSLLPYADLHLGDFARWLDLVQMLRPAPYVAVEPVSILQLSAQVVATTLEGLHRRLHPDRSRFPGLSKRALQSARKAAVAGAVESLSGEVDPATAKQAFTDAVGFVGQTTYSERVTELTEPVRSLAPYLFGPDHNRWVKDMRDIRNEQSHQLSTGEFDDREVRRYYVMAATGRWALQLALLQQLVTDGALHDALRECDKLGYAMANVDRERFWTQYSAYAAYRAHTSLSPG